MKQINPMITLTLHIPEQEGFDSKKQQFFYVKDTTITLEHSLVSVAKWESIHHHPFLDRKNKTAEETLDYIKCMTIEEDVDPNVYRVLTQEDLAMIDKFITDPMTGTKFSDRPSANARRGLGQIESAELIYWEMIQSGIPNEWEHRHFNQLRALLRVCANHNQSGEKISPRELNRMYSSINDARRAKLHSKG